MSLWEWFGRDKCESRGYVDLQPCRYSLDVCKLGASHVLELSAKRLYVRFTFACFPVYL